MPDLLPRTAAFYQARAAWAEQRSPAMARGTAPTPEQIAFKQQAKRWGYLIGREQILVRSGRARYDLPVKVDEAALGEILDALSQAGAQALIEEMDKGAAALAVSVWQNWPVKSGFSKSRIYLEWDVTTDALVARLVNRAPYVLLIKGGPWRKAISAAQRVAIQIGEAVGRNINPPTE